MAIYSIFQDTKGNRWGGTLLGGTECRGELSIFEFTHYQNGLELNDFLMRGPCLLEIINPENFPAPRLQIHPLLNRHAPPSYGVLYPQLESLDIRTENKLLVFFQVPVPIKSSNDSIRQATYQSKIWYFHVKP